MTVGFTESPWFMNTAKAVVPFLLSGSFIHRTKSETVPQVHEYQEEEPYTSYEQVKKTRTNSAGQVEDYYENEKVTRYRSVRKEFDYNATKLSQSIDLNFKADFDLVKAKHTIGIEKDYSESIIVHDYNMPNIDLYPPKKKNLESPGTLWGKYTDEIKENFKAKLIKVWEAEYCVLPQTLNHTSVSENVLRCRKSASAKNTDFVNTWFLNNYGISNSTVEKVLGDF